MKLSIGTIALLFAAVASAVPPQIPLDGPTTTYDGTKVLRVSIDNKQQAEDFRKIVEDLRLPLWTERIMEGANVDLEVSKERLAAFEEAVSLGNYRYSVMHEDLGAAIRAESEAMSEAAAPVPDLSWFNAYHTYDDHLLYLKAVVGKFSGNSELITLGKSYQGRPITGIHIYGKSGKGKKSAVIFHGTVHAREWISTMVNEYIAYTLLNNYKNSTAIAKMVDNYDFYILPVVNPDGFVYTHTPANRLWRKNRQPTAGSTCIGTDINRNWDSHWGDSGGASTDPCNETFKGKSVGDTPEYKALSEFNKKLATSSAGAKVYIDWHAYSQMFLYPYGWSCSVLPKDNAELSALAKGIVAAFKVPYGKIYKYGPICPTIYKVTGDSVDYSYDVDKIKYSFTTELRDTGTYGFLLPPNQILPSGIEAFAGVKYLIENIK